MCTPLLILNLTLLSFALEVFVESERCLHLSVGVRLTHGISQLFVLLLVLGLGNHDLIAKILFIYLNLWQRFLFFHPIISVVKV